MCTLLYVFVYGFLVHGPMGPSQWEITLTISVIVVVIVVFDMFLYSYNFHLSFSFFLCPSCGTNTYWGVCIPMHYMRFCYCNFRTQKMVAAILLIVSIIVWPLSLHASTIRGAITLSLNLILFH